MATTEKQLEWLVTIFVYNNNYYDLEHQDTIDYYTMEEQTKYIRNQLRYVPYREEVKIILVEARIKNYKDPSTGKVYIEPTLSILQKGPEEWLHKVQDFWRKEDAINILTNGNSFEKILTALKKDFSAKRNIVVTAGHGSIIGVNYFIPGLNPNSGPSPVKIDDPGFIEKNIPDENEFIKELSSEISLEKGKKLLFLSTNEIAAAISNVFPNKKADIVVMFNCLMQNIFAQFDLKDSAEWFIAPLSGIYIPGFNYYAVLKAISKKPESISTDEVSKIFIDSIRIGNHYSKFKTDIEGSWKISAVNLNSDSLNDVQKKFDAVFKEINKLDDNGIPVINELNKVLPYLFSYSRYCLDSIQLFDLGSFLASLLETIQNADRYKTLSDCIVEFQEVLNNSQKNSYKFTGNNFYDSDEDLKHYDNVPENRTKIADIGLLLPINKMNSDLLNSLLDSRNYNTAGGGIKNFIPKLIASQEYAKTILKLHNNIMPMNL